MNPAGEGRTILFSATKTWDSANPQVSGADSSSLLARSAHEPQNRRFVGSRNKARAR